MANDRKCKLAKTRLKMEFAHSQTKYTFSPCPFSLQKKEQIEKIGSLRRYPSRPACIRAARELLVVNVISVILPIRAFSASH